MKDGAKSVFDLSPPEKPPLLEELWDNLSANPSDVPVTDWQREEVDRRKANSMRHPDSAVDRPHNSPKFSRVRLLYERYPFGQFCYGAKRDRHNRPLLEFLDTLSCADRVFDAGCGAGYWLDKCRALPSPPHRLHGVELSPSRCAALARDGLSMLCGDVLQLGIRGDCADAVICNGVIHHTPDPLRAFQELVRVTRPGGRIFLAVYNRWNPYFYLVHRASYPLRWAYWRWGERVLDLVLPVARLLYQPLARLVFGRKLDDATGRILLMDQVMTPYAALFSAAMLNRYAKQCGCDISPVRRTDDFMMLTAVFTKRP